MSDKEQKKPPTFDEHMAQLQAAREEKIEDGFETLRGDIELAIEQVSDFLKRREGHYHGQVLGGLPEWIPDHLAKDFRMARDVLLDGRFDGRKYQVGEIEAYVRQWFQPEKEEADQIPEKIEQFIATLARVSHVATVGERTRNATKTRQAAKRERNASFREDAKRLRAEEKKGRDIPGIIASKYNAEQEREGTGKTIGPKQVKNILQEGSEPS